MGFGYHENNNIIFSLQLLETSNMHVSFQGALEEISAQNHKYQTGLICDEFSQGKLEEQLEKLPVNKDNQFVYFKLQLIKQRQLNKFVPYLLLTDIIKLDFFYMNSQEQIVKANISFVEGSFFVQIPKTNFNDTILNKDSIKCLTFDKKKQQWLDQDVSLYRKGTQDYSLQCKTNHFSQFTVVDTDIIIYKKNQNFYLHIFIAVSLGLIIIGILLFLFLNSKESLVMKKYEAVELEEKTQLNTTN